MPVYVYRNLTTGETFEVQQSITESAWTEHPETGDPVKRVVQPVGIAFKGSGFYVNDSRSATKPAAASANAASAPSSTPTTSNGSSTPGSSASSSSGSSAGASATSAAASD